jgi:hypothetical protein
MGFLFEVEYLVSGAVLRAAADVHHFQVVLVGQCASDNIKWSIASV